MFLNKSYAGKNLVSEIWDLEIAHSQWDCRIFKSTISLEQIDETASFFLHVDIDSQKLKVDWKFLSCAWLKMGVANLFSRLKNWLYLKN